MTGRIRTVVLVGSLACLGCDGATTLEVHGFDGLRETITLAGETEHTVSTPTGETTMILARTP
jgi:hypothetical protein